MNQFLQYLKDSRAELNHVAWPTQAQTIVYTILVALFSLFISFYLGFFDYLFTSGLAAVVSHVPASNPIVVTQISTSTVSTSSNMTASSSLSTSTKNQ